ASSADGLARVPLDLGCADTLLDEAAMAALLAPWQLVLKHDPRRLATIRAAAAASRCAWFSEPTAATPEAKPPTGNLLLGRDAPIPVVVGWLPVDADGEAEQAPAAAGDLWGPCGGLCRGACGVDCPWINCRRRELTWCEQHPGAGGNTGMKFDAVELDCGTATGCVNHDDCYDRCNVGYGCGSWGALACRSGPRGCDEVACLTYGTVRCSAWAAGVGPFESRITFTYPPNTRPGEPAVGELDLQTCPTDDGSLQWELAPPATPVAGAAGAESYCSGLTLDGHDDWRLPTIAELPMIEAGCPIVNCLDISVYGVPFCEGCPSGRGPGDAGCYLDPRLSGPCGTYWTSTVYEDFPGDPLPGRWVWSALAGAEYVQSSSTYAGYHARCVRP
ncbi:MAG TPA: hypothetical protein PKA64_23955, partial [Myxococcota bacterium]|nr:hypothetical protein [Myxococcota bacterium]